MPARFPLGRITGRARPFVGLAASALLLATPERASAQLKLFSVHGDDSLDLHGQSVSRAGDVNADGVPDFIAGGSRDETMGAMAGQAKVYSGLDGSVLHTFYGGAAGDEFGETVGAAGDVDGDGYDDVIVGSRYYDIADATGNARVFSGLDGSVLHTLSGTVDATLVASPVAGVGDVNTDGYDDVIVGEPDVTAGASDSGRVRVYSGFDGSVLYERTGALAEGMGFSVDGAGDVDGDGTPDFIVGAELSIFPHVWVYSGAEGGLLHEFVSGAVSGSSVSGAGDVDNDGFDDLIVGVRFDLTAGSAAGAAYVHSGADGSVLHSFFGASGHQLGIDVDEGGDFDGDGHADLLIGMLEGPGTLEGTASMHLYSGSDGSLLRQLESGVPDDEFGRAVGMIEDLNGDGRPDYIGGAFSGDVNGPASGSVYVFSAVPLISSYCVSTVNSTGSAATITSTGYASIWKDDLVLIAEGLPPNEPGLFVRGPSAAQNPFGNGFLCLGPPVVRILPNVTSNASGVASSPFHVTSHGFPVVNAGETWYFQYLYRDPAGGPPGFNLSDGLQVTFIP